MKMYSDNAMLSVELDADMLRMIENAMGGLKSESRKVLKNAINATAKQARTDLINRTKGQYTAKKSVLTKSTKKENAKVSNLEATIKVESETRELRDFKTSVSKQGAKAQLLAGGSLKLLQSQKGNRAKAFFAKFESGHKAIVQRQEGEIYKTPEGRKNRIEKYGPNADMTLIKKLLGISAPKMMASEKVFGVMRPKIYDYLMTNIHKEIQRTLSSQR